MQTSDYQHITDLFGNSRTIKADAKRGARPLDERSELVRFFHLNALDRENKQFAVSYIGYRLSHLKIDDLYYLKSVCEDSVRRGGNFSKTFFGLIRVK